MTPQGAQHGIAGHRTIPTLSLPARTIGRAVERALWSPVLDEVAPIAIVAVFSMALLVFHVATQSRVIPYHDGSHHVANVANLAAGIRANGLGFAAASAVRSPPDFLTYGFLVVPTLAIGDSRVAFGIGWIICLTAIAVVVSAVCSKAHGYPTRTFALSLLLFFGLFQSQLGGAWDTRVDLFAVTLGTLSLLMAIRGSLFSSLLLGLAAGFAKGAAVPLLAPLLFAALILGFFRVRRCRPCISTCLGALLLIGLAGLFTTSIAPQAVSYNLMATGGSSLSERLQLFTANAQSYLEHEPDFYSRELLTRYQAWIIPTTTAVFVLVAFARCGRIVYARVGLFACICLIYTYILLTISPLHSDVLTVWFLPAIAVFVVFITQTAPLAFGRRSIVALSCVLLAGGLMTAHLEPPAYDPAFTPYVSSVFGQAEQIAETLKDQVGAVEPADVLLLVNFLSSEGPLAHNYDAYRVLIDERLSHSSLALDGWELGTYGEDWQSELRARSNYSHIVFVLQENPSGVPWENAPQRVGRSVWDAMQRFRSTYPGCLVPAAAPIDLPHVGRREALLLTATDECRQALFAG